jgi:hypothetical protein
MKVTHDTTYIAQSDPPHLFTLPYAEYLNKNTRQNNMRLCNVTGEYLSTLYLKTYEYSVIQSQTSILLSYITVSSIFHFITL